MHPNRHAQPIINPHDLEQLVAMRQAQQSLKERLKLVDESLDKMESTVLNALDAGALLDVPGFDISVQTFERRYPAWKEHFLGRLGKSEADAVLASTLPTIYRKLIVK